MRVTQRTTQVLITALWTCSLSLTAPDARAHHGTHSSLAVAGSAGPTQRLSTVGHDAGMTSSYSSTSDPEAAGRVMTLAPFADYALSDQVAVGLLVPVLRVEPEGGNAEFGAGNVQALGKYAWATGSSLDSTWALHTRLGLPTQTLQLGVDPGPVWDFGTGLVHTQLLGTWLGQAAVTLLGDARRAGTSLDAEATLRLGYSLVKPLRALIGAQSRTRVAAWCHLGGATQWCRTGRASEPETEIGETIVVGELGFELVPTSSWGLAVSAQVPLTRARDFDGLISLTWVYLGQASAPLQP